VTEPTVTEPTVTETTEAPSTVVAGAESPSDYLGNYSLADDVFGTMTTVTVDGGTRTIQTNALPNHETGDFPNDGNPNTISAQDLTWSFPLEPTWTGEATQAITPGVALNGVKLEPGTAETMTCASGETYRVEALQDLYSLGLDFNNAHVQPTGEYHYHGISQLLVDAYSHDGDLVLIGFAADGHLIYYSKSGALTSGYTLSSEPRTGTGCEMSLPIYDGFEVEGTSPDGTFTSDWEWSADTGDLDECNGAVIDGTYAYVVTETFPYISRCLMGEFTQSSPGGPPPTP
jgi:hypothetical protein